MRFRRRLLLFRAILVGCAAGLVAVAFQLSLQHVEKFRETVSSWFWGLGEAGFLLFPVLGMGVVLFVAMNTKRWCPEAAGSGIPHLKGVLMRIRSFDEVRLIFVKFIGGILSIGTGLSLGREGPTVQMGGAIGQFISRRFRERPEDGLLLIAVGAGAGLSAAFNAPLAGFLFVMEELHFEFAPMPYISALAASITADTISRMVSGQLPSLLVLGHSTPPLSMIPGFAVLGVLCGLLAVAFKRGLIQGIRWSDHHPEFSTWLLPCLAGAAGGIAVLFLPEIAGGGQSTSEGVLNGALFNHTLGFALLLLTGKFLLTLVSYFARVPGGIFAPMLAIGGLLGYIVGRVYSIAFTGCPPNLPEVCSVLGMAGFFSGVVHAPLTGLALILEMTANFKLLFPMMLTNLISFTISEWWGEAPVYEELLNEDLRRNGPPPLLFQEPTCIHLQVEEGSDLADRPLGTIDLPEGILVINVNRRGHKFVPSGKTVLVAGDGLEVMVSGEVATLAGEILEFSRGKGTSDMRKSG